jgi:Glu-tRNA(Gln) amidotransferase subunit E-like FAD-binding protein
VGLKCGIEIHRQIESHKLFCRCNSELIDGEPDFRIKRLLRASTSEMGEQDTVATFEMAKGKYAIYEGFHRNTCLVELDEAPVDMINQDALQAVLQVCKLLHMRLADEIHVMRKQILDYSNTSSFQRTALVGVDGYIQTTNGKVGIQSVCIEEDAARKMKSEKDHVVYRLDRLGIPLMEIATAPDMHTPDQVKEVASYLGMVLKSTGKFRSGLGTIRQDLNVSIHGHPRVEIKGVQDLRLIPLIIENEIQRQLEAIKQGKARSEVRKANEDGSTTFLRPMAGAARMYVETDHPSFSVKDLYQKVKVPELLTEKTISLEKKYRLSTQMAHALLAEDKIDAFEVFANKFTKIEPEFIARVLMDIPKELKSRFKITTQLQDKDLGFVLEHVQAGKIPKSAVLEVLKERAEGKTVNIDQYTPVNPQKLEQEIKELIEKEKGAPMNALMGMIMGKYKGRVDGKRVMELLKKYL